MLALYIVLFLLFAFYPNLLSSAFNNELKSKYFQLYYNDNIDINMTTNLKSSMQKLDEIIKREPLYYSGFKAYVFKVNNPYYLLSNPFDIANYINYGHTSLGNTLKSRVVIPYLNPKSKNSAYTLLGLLHHEAIHTLMYHKYGIFHSVLHKTWIVEGYPVYRTLISKTANYSKKFYKETLSNKYENLDIRHKYLLCGLMVKYAMEDLGYSLEQLMNYEVDFGKVLKGVYNKYKNKVI